MKERTGVLRKAEWAILIIAAIYLLPGIGIFLSEFVFHTYLWWKLPRPLQEFFVGIYWIPFLVLQWFFSLLG